MSVFDPLADQTVEVLTTGDDDRELPPIVRPGAYWKNGICLNPDAEQVNMAGQPVAEAPGAPAVESDDIARAALAQAAACSPVVYALLRVLLNVEDRHGAPVVGYPDLAALIAEGEALRASLAAPQAVNVDPAFAIPVEKPRRARA